MRETATTGKPTPGEPSTAHTHSTATAPAGVGRINRNCKYEQG